jgi:hypothetical protein
VERVTPFLSWASGSVFVASLVIVGVAEVRDVAGACYRFSGQ